MTTHIEKVFRRTPEGFYREIYLHFLSFLNPDGTLRSRKLDKEEHRDLWREAKEGERSPYGECTYPLPGYDRPVRLICVRKG